MVNATLLYNGDAGDSAAIILGVTNEDPVNCFIIPNAGGQGVCILKKGS